MSELLNFQTWGNYALGQFIANRVGRFDGHEMKQKHHELRAAMAELQSRVDNTLRVSTLEGIR